MSSTLTLQRLLDYYPIAQSLADALSTHGCYAKNSKAQLHLDNHHTCPSPAWCLAATCEGAYDLLAPEVYHTMHIDPSSDQQAKIAAGLLPCARRAVRRVIIDISSAGTWLEPFLESLNQLQSLTLSFAPCTNGLALRGVTIPASVRQLSLICPSLELVQHLFATRWQCRGGGGGHAMGAHAGMLEGSSQQEAQLSKRQSVVDNLGLGGLSQTFIWTWVFDDRSLASWVSIASQLPGEVLIYAKHICCLPHGLEDIDELVQATYSIAQPLARRIILVWTVERSLRVTYLGLDPDSGAYTSHTTTYTLGGGVSDWDGLDSADEAWAKLRRAERSG